MTGTTSGAGARPLMIRLDDRDPGAVDPDLVGGKAAALARLVRSGHPVPDGVVLTTEAYRRSIPAGGPIDPEGPPADDAEIDRWFDDRELPGEVRSIVDRIAADAGGLLAVRSSATGEDAALAAFPGQYRSLLDVSPDEFGAALRRVWASLWHGAPRAYRLRSDPNGAAPAMAVIVMDMVPAEAGGVVFSRDPVGAADALRIELVGGTAERLVAGRVTPTDLVVPPDIASAAAASRLGPAVGAIVEHAMATEAEWGDPVDVEFAIDPTGRPWIVQARPITTAPPTEPDGPGLLDHCPGFASYEMTARPVFLIGFATGAVMALRWLLLGGLVATTTAAGMTAWYARQLEPVGVVAVVVAFAVPGFAWLLLDLHDRIRVRALLGLALVVIGAALGFVIGTATWNGVFGATHPSSTADVPADSRVHWIWTGAGTADSARVVAAPVDPGEWDVLVRSDALGAQVRIPAERIGRVVRADLTSLDAGTSYTVRVVRRGQSPSSGVDEATVRTVAPGDTGITIAVGSCMRTGSNGAVFDAIAALEPDLFVAAGDLHYGNIDRDDPDEFRDVLDVVLSKPGPSHLFRTTPIAYVWDDHDYGSNNADATSPSRPAVMEVYREYVPHHPLAGPEAPIFQAFDVGAVRVVLTDVRSARQPGRTMLGEEQLRWLEHELLESHRTRALTIWVSPVGWIGGSTEGGDAWDGFDEERRRLADFVADNGIDRLVMVTGDAHMVAIDDGTNSGYAADGGRGFPVLNAAALDRPGAVKGGPYSEGTYPGGGQFGVVEVSPTDDGVLVRLSGRDWTGATLVSYEREFRVPAEVPVRPGSTDGPPQLTRRAVPSQ